MNKLILIGNGFDLAHGLKTSYKDFLLNHMHTSLSCTIDKKVLGHDDFNIINTMDFYQTQQFRNAANQIDHYPQVLLDIFSNAEVLNYRGSSHYNGFKVDIKNPILKLAIGSCYTVGWADIEQIYYDELIKIASPEGPGRNKTERIIELNKYLVRIKNHLYDYLKTLKGAETIRYMYNKFNEPFSESDFLNGFADLDKCNRIMILNFNYTYTPELYLHTLAPEFDEKPEIESLHIHGELQNDENPLIFGFGDEMDDHYRILEKMDNQCLDNIKSFGYFRTKNLRKLSQFLEESEYQVQIMGHSCGLSDRVMLNRVFEHEHCKSIKIFHRRKGPTFEETNYKELTQNISRHFNKKQRMRDLVVPYDEGNYLPQLIR